MSLNLSAREKWFLGFGALAVLSLLAWTFLVSPGLERVEQLDRSIVRHKQELARLEAMVEQWRQLKAQSESLVDQLGQREADFSLAGYLEELIKASDLSNKVRAIRPLPPEDVPGGLTRLSVDLRLEGAPFQGLVKLLYRIEFSEKLLTVTRLTLNSAKGGLNVGLRVLTLKKS